MTKLLGRYKNGNYKVAIFDDGTKIRYNDLDNLNADFPESIDIKITNMCNMGCSMCHEGSTPDGKHGWLEHPILDTLHPYTELAIGGGNPLEHPDLESFLIRMKEKNVICNLTVHLDHMIKNFAILANYINRELVHGVGISVHRPITREELGYISAIPNAVIHVIAGLVTDETLESLAYHDLKLLILGYKRFGRGKQYYESSHNDKYISQNIEKLGEKILDMKESFSNICFDNLAIKQLKVKDLLSEDEWNRFYMGDDGMFTMYIDLVSNKYAVSSTSERHFIPDNATIDDIFKRVKEDRENGRTA